MLQPNTYTVTTTVNEGYAPYEQRRKDADPNPKWDIYGLAATLYFAVTGQKPETSVDRKLYGDALIAPQKHRSDLSSWLNQAILQGMDLEPDNRPASMQIWLGALHPPQPRIVKPPEPEPVKTPFRARPIALLEFIETWRDLFNNPTKIGRWLIIFLGLSAVIVGLNFLTRRQPPSFRVTQIIPTPIPTPIPPTPSNLLSSTGKKRDAM